MQYAKRVVGRKMYGGQSTHLPLKVNTAGVIPPIFASSILLFPAQIASFVQTLVDAAHRRRRCSRATGATTSSTSLLIIFFCYFYTAVTFNPVDVADNMKKYGGFIPGIRPGKTTAEYIDQRAHPHHLRRRALRLGGLRAAARCLQSKFKVPFYFGGTGLLIVVGVALDTVQQIESHLITRHYEGFTGPKGRASEAGGCARAASARWTLTAEIDLKDHGHRVQEPRRDREDARRESGGLRRPRRDRGDGAARGHHGRARRPGHGALQEAKVEPAFLGYGDPPYPAVLCISVNDEVVHGIPQPGPRASRGRHRQRGLRRSKDGYYGDAARTIPVGQVSAAAQKLMDVTRESLERAIAQCRVGNRLKDIGRAVQEHVEANGFSVVREFVGHGIGQQMHEDPPVPNYVDGRQEPAAARPAWCSPSSPWSTRGPRGRGRLRGPLDGADRGWQASRPTSSTRWRSPTERAAGAQSPGGSER